MEPKRSTNPQGGIFQNILQPSGTSAQLDAVKSQLSQATAITGAVYQTLNLLPEGELKGWLTANAFEFWKKVWQLFAGKKWTEGDYRLGERLSDQIYCNADISRPQVSDQMVDIAHTVFNQLFGVRISTEEDLNALDGGVAAYKARAASKGISTDAIERAVYLKQHFFPASTYNKVCWDLRYFEMYPLVDRIPDYELGKWYTGELLGGSYAVDGVIPVSASDILDQYLFADFDPNTGVITTTDGVTITPGVKPGDGNGEGSVIDEIINFVKTADPIVLLGIAAGGYYVYTEIEKEI